MNDTTSETSRLSEYPDRIQLQTITTLDEALAYLTWGRDVLYRPRKDRCAEIITVIDALRAENARLRQALAAAERERDQERARFKEATDRQIEFVMRIRDRKREAFARADTAEAALAESRSEVERYTLALAWYADPSTWDDGVDHDDPEDYGEFQHAVDAYEDQGKLAREALAIASPAMGSENPAYEDMLVKRCRECKVFVGQPHTLTCSLLGKDDPPASSAAQRGEGE